MTQSFPEYFHASNSHMFMFEDDDGTFHLLPPNQQDWSYTIRKENEDTWVVKGKNDWDTKELIAHLVDDYWVLEDAGEE